MDRPDVSLVVTSFERPQHLVRSLRSIRLQRGFARRIEVIVADDGSSDDTLQVIKRFAKDADFPVTMTTHEHNGFRVARSRNNGVAASRAPYLLFIDGDCVLPPDYVAWHLRLRRFGVVVTGDCYRLDEAASKEVSDAEIASDALKARLCVQERRRLRGKALRALAYALMRVPMRPRLTGNGFGIWRSDFERVNGFDETFVGWGFEDTDLQHRLSLTGLRFHTILHRAVTYHFWHPPHMTMRRARDAANYEHFRRASKQPWCRGGLVQDARRRMTVHEFGPSQARFAAA